MCACHSRGHSARFLACVHSAATVAIAIAVLISYFSSFLLFFAFCLAIFFFVTLDVIASGSETTTTKRDGAASEMSPSDAYQLALRRSYLPDWLYS